MKPFVIERVVDAELVSDLEIGMRQIFTSPARFDTEHRHERTAGVSYAGYTPPSVEGVREYGPNPHRHFWDIDPHGHRLPHEQGALAERLHSELVLLATNTLRQLGEAWATQAGEDVRGGSHLLRVIHYLNEHADGTELMPAHLDWGVITLFLGGTSSGLQVLTDGEWRDVEIPPGSVFCAPGTLASIYSEKRVRALRHRVLAKSVGRIAFTFFLAVREEVVLPNGENAGSRYRRIESGIRREI